jgi:hypothetical protein
MVHFHIIDVYVASFGGGKTAQKSGNRRFALIIDSQMSSHPPHMNVTSDMDDRVPFFTNSPYVCSKGIRIRLFALPVGKVPVPNPQPIVIASNREDA